MKPSEFKDRLKRLQQRSSLQPDPAPQPDPTPEPPPPPKPIVLAPQCMFEKIENGGLIALYCLEDEGHEGEHRFGESL